MLHQVGSELAVRSQERGVSALNLVPASSVSVWKVLEMKLSVILYPGLLLAASE